jgi:hypothetical protein
MKKTTIILFAAFTVLLAISVYAAKPDLPVDGRGIRVQNFAPDGKKDVALTNNSQTTDMRDDLQYLVQNQASSCKFRTMTTATKVGALKYLAKGAIYQRGVNNSTPFFNSTSCGNGKMERQ